MTKNRTQKEGYIIMLALLIIALAVALLTAVVQQSFSYQRQARLNADRNSARLLALSSLELVASQLSQVISEKDEKEPQKGETKEQKTGQVLEPLAQWLLKIMPFLNRWQTIELSSPQEGLEGTIKLYVACEQGKINIAGFEKELEGTDTEPSAQAKQKAQEANGQKNGQPPQPQNGAAPKRSALAAIDDLFKKEKDSSLKEALKSFKSDFRRFPEDASEFLHLSPFAKLRDSLFVPLEDVKKPLFLMDLFTVRQENGKLNPWLLTRSTKTLLGLVDKKETKIDKDFVKQIKPSMQWATDWDTVLAPRLGKKFAAFEPAIQELFAAEFEAKAFSVVSYCTVGSVTQKLYALLELSQPGQDLSPKSLIFKVSKIYWI